MITAELSAAYLPKKTYGIEFNRYQANNSIAMDIVDPETGESWMMATICVDGVDPDDGHVLIKDWSENEGILRSLIDAKIIDYPISTHATGFVSAAMCPLLVTLEFDQS